MGNMSKVKVLHIITRMIKGGAQEDTLLTVINLDRERYRTSLVSGPSTGSEGEIESKARQLGVELTTISELVRNVSPINDLKALYKLYSLIKKAKYDIVHTHSSKAGILGRVGAKLAGVKTIIHTPHGSIFYPDADIPGVSGKFWITIFLLLEKVAAYLADKITTLTESEAKHYLKLGIGSNDKFAIIRSGTELSRFTDVKVDVASKRKKLGISVNSTVVTTVARLTSEKGHSYLIDAAKEVVTASADELIFMFVGDGDLRGELERKVNELGLDGKILFLGLRDDVPELLAISDLFVLPSLYEAQGKVLVEAIAVGLPVIATKVGGVPDVVVNGKTGILVPPRNSQALAKAIISLITDKVKAKQMGEAGRQVIPEFSVETMIEKIDRLYYELVRNQ
jgi:glycosyltransferase involved in cell wall biosynthesis